MKANKAVINSGHFILTDENKQYPCTSRF
jgi:hypothetical protein